MSNLKLGVEVVSAHDLTPKDGQGSCNAFVELHFDGQKFRTTIKEKDINPVWNESFYFNISDPERLSYLVLDASVYHFEDKANKIINSKSFLGKVHLNGTSFVPYSDAVVLHYPLEKKRVFSRIKGELGLKVFVTDDPAIRPSNPLPAMESFMSTDQSLGEEEQTLNKDTKSSSNGKSKRRNIFHSLANQNQEKKQEMKYAPQPPKFFQMQAGPSSQGADYAVKETSPTLGGGKVVGGWIFRGNGPASAYDLVEKMQYLFVRVEKARDLPSKDGTGSLDPYVEVRIGNYCGQTKYYEKTKHPEWNEVFAFAAENLQSSVLEIVVKDKDFLMDDFAGKVRFDLHEVPLRVPPDSPLAPEWYRLEDKKGEKKGEVMLAVWRGTQADEAFPNAWHSDAITPTGTSPSSSSHIRSKVYHSPRLWYVRVRVIEAQDLVMSDKSRIADAYVKVQLGNQVLKTKPVQSRNANPRWDYDMMFVAAEPFEEHLIFTVEDRVSPNKEETLGKVAVPLQTVDRRADDRFIRSKWFNLEKSISASLDGEQSKKDKFFSKLHLTICLDGGYHVLDESTYYSSDLRPTAKQLWKSSIGILELGILSARGINPMKTREGKGTSDTYCVAKYGHKWVRTRTIIDSLNPKYNEQYTWEVYDVATVLTLGVFDNGHIGSSDDHKDTRIGKVRIRISTLETGRIYTNSYPLLMLHPSGVKKMGEIHLAIRFSCTSWTNMMNLYFRPPLPKMHYKKPLNIIEQEKLRQQAVSMIAARLSRAEPPLRREVIEYMSDTDAHLWSMRRSKANFYRLRSVFTGLVSLGQWLGEVAKWKNPTTTILAHILFLILLSFPELIFPTVFLYLFVIGMWNYRYRMRSPPHMDTRISFADGVSPDELDEEFDTFPTTQSSDIIRWRYDRLRSVAGRIQAVVGDVVSQLERIEALLSWRDPRATTIFAIFCLVAALVMYMIPFQLVLLLSGFYMMRHPKLRQKTPGAAVNFFRRLPAKTDTML